VKFIDTVEETISGFKKLNRISPSRESRTFLTGKSLETEGTNVIYQNLQSMKAGGSRNIRNSGLGDYSFKLDKIEKRLGGGCHPPVGYRVKS